MQCLYNNGLEAGTIIGLMLLIVLRCIVAWHKSGPAIAPNNLRSGVFTAPLFRFKPT